MYKLSSTDFIIRISDNIYIPPDTGNVDYQEYLAWINDGNTPAPVDIPEVVVPQAVTRFQARAALYLAGLLPTIEAMMNDPSTDMLAKLAWQDALEFKRTSPTVLTMGAALGLTDEQIDQLFITAATIDA